jgi:hypothetical protein
MLQTIAPAPAISIAHDIAESRPKSQTSARKRWLGLDWRFGMIYTRAADSVEAFGISNPQASDYP